MLPNSKHFRKRKADEAHITPGDDEQAAPPAPDRVQFIYKPLEYATEFRLLRLFPGGNEDELACEVFHADISDPPAYEALSYTWGDTTLCQELRSTTGLIKITENCFSAIMNLRHATVKRTLWIDAICIAQADDLEKNHQIPLMPRIYARATKVLIHLGHQVTSDDTESLFPHLRKPEEAFHGSMYEQQLAKFLSLPWFSRIWVLQEVTMAREAVIVVGPTVLDWGYLSIATIHASGLRPTDAAGQVPAVLRISKGDEKPLQDLLSLIATARSCQSSDPRDRIYALLGLVHERSGIDLAPNYTKTAKAVYTDITAEFLRIYNCLDFLSDIGSDQVLSKASTSPSTELDRFNPGPITSSIQHLNVELQKAAETLSKLQEEMLNYNGSDLRHQFFSSSSTLKSLWDNLSKLVDRTTDSINHHMTPDLWDAVRSKALECCDLLGDLRADLKRVSSRFMDIEACPPELQFQSWLNLESPTKISTSWLKVVQSAKEMCYSRLNVLESAKNELDLSEAASMEVSVFRKHNTYLTAEHLFNTVPVEQESVKVIDTNLDLPSWVPDYRYDRQLFSFTYWMPNQFKGKSVAHYNSCSPNRPNLSLEVRAIFVNTLQSTECVPGQRLRLCHTSITFTGISWPNDTAFARDFEQSLTEIDHGATLTEIRVFSRGRRLALTETSLAIVPASFKLGDIVAVVYGGTVPYLLRPCASGADSFQLIGECYLYGIKGSQFAPNYGELLGYFKNHVKLGVEGSELGDVKDFVLRDGKENGNASESSHEARKIDTGSTESKDHAMSDMEQDGLPWKTIYLV